MKQDVMLYTGSLSIKHIKKPLLIFLYKYQSMALTSKQWRHSQFSSGHFHTCDIVIRPKVHLDVVPLHNHAALSVGSSNSHVDVILVRKRVYRQRFRGHGLVEREICGETQRFERTVGVRST